MLSSVSSGIVMEWLPGHQTFKLYVTSGVTCKLKPARGQKSTQPEEINKCAGTDWQYKNTSLFNPYPANVENMSS